MSQLFSGKDSFLFQCHQYLSSEPDFRLHGVSHDAASPMPVPSNSRVEGICGFFCGWAIFLKLSGGLAQLLLYLIAQRPFSRNLGLV